MAEAQATLFGVPTEILPEEESMTTKTMQADSDLEVPRGEVQPLRIAVNPKLLKAARSGDINILNELLRPKDFSSRASVGEIAITVPEYDATQEDTSCLLGVTLEGNTALHIVASRGHLEIAMEICRREISLLAAPNTRLDTPLHCAARAGDDKMVSCIIQFLGEDEIKVSRVLMAKNWDGSNALHEAAKYDRVHVAEKLMETDVRLASMLNDADMSPLFLAIVIGSLNVAKTLLRSSSWKKASPASYTGSDKQTVLHVAVLMSQELTQDILQREPMLTKAADYLGRLPLHYAASNGRRETVKLLLECDLSTAYLSDADGFFPIHVAAIMGNIPVIDQILRQCPDTEELLDRWGRNFLHVAFRCGRLDVVKKIISKRPDLRKLLNDQDNMGNTPLHTAVMNANQKSMHFLLQDKTVHVNVINHDGFTPLDLAYAKLDPGSSITGKEKSILNCLAFSKAVLGPSTKWHAFNKVVSSSVDEFKEKSPNDQDKRKPSGNDKVKKKSSSGEEKEKMKKWWSQETTKFQEQQPNVSKNFVTATALIATVTFAAGLTVPGGFIADDHSDHGTAVLGKEYAFKVFLVSNAFAFLCSIYATFWLMGIGSLTVDMRALPRLFRSIGWWIWAAFIGMSTAFAAGTYATLPSSYKSIGIILLIIEIPTLLTISTLLDLYSFRSVLGRRQGYRHWIWPTAIYPYVQNLLRPALVPNLVFFGHLLLVPVCYTAFFLFPLVLGNKK